MKLFLLSPPMISLTKLNHQLITINAIYIERVEETPDTVITLTNGKKLLVIESAEEVTKRVTDYYKKISLLPIVREIKEEQTDVEE